MDVELETFKKADLRVFAANEGYTIDKRESSRGSTVMRHVNDDKIIVSVKPDGHYTYFSVRDDRDHGTIIDFLKNRHNFNLGQIRKVLREWSGQPTNVFPSVPALTPVTKDRSTVQARYETMRFPTGPHPYLLRERKIPAVTLEHWRFNSRVKIDKHGNAVFPHFDETGLCGYELKNKEFTGFAVGGSKGLWLSKAIDEDRRLVIAESGIDAISHAVLFPDTHTRYASIGGKPNPIQPELLRLQILNMPSGSEIVAAMDSDADGRALAAMVGDAVIRSGHDVRFRQEEPQGFKDWNDQLRTIQIKSFSPRPEVCSR